MVVGGDGQTFGDGSVGSNRVCLVSASDSVGFVASGDADSTWSVMAYAFKLVVAEQSFFSAMRGSVALLMPIEWLI